MPVAVTDNKSFIMPDVNVKVNAAFKVTEYKITCKDTENGTISGDTTANYGQNIELTISPDTGYELAALSVEQESNNDKVTVTDNKRFTMSASNITVSAAFKLTDYTITYSAATNGNILGDATANYNNIELTISPDNGYMFDNLSLIRNDNNQNVNVTNNKTFVMPHSDLTVNVSFKLADNEISCNITSGSITVPETANYSDKIKFIVTPDDGYSLSAIIIPGVEFDLISRYTDTGVEIYKLTMPNNVISINVEFETLTIYSIFYKAEDDLTSLRYRSYMAATAFI